LSGWWKEEYFYGLAQTAKYNGSVGCQVEDENKAVVRSNKPLDGRKK